MESTRDQPSHTSDDESAKKRFLEVYEKEHAITMKVLRAYPVDQLDFQDVCERTAGKKMSGAGKQRAIPRDDERFVRVRDAGRSLRSWPVLSVSETNSATGSVASTGMLATLVPMLTVGTAEMATLFCVAALMT